MLFNSYIFILAFLPLTIVVYFLLNKKSHNGGKVWLAAMSLLFYAYYNPWYLLIIAASIGFNYLIGRIITNEKRPSRRKVWLVLAVTANLGSLFYYKYFDFFLESINLATGSDFVLRRLLLPLAISFFTFKQVAYIVDSYRGEVPPYRFIDYLLFVAFFPQLIVGPILLHSELLPQLLDPAKKKPDYENIAKGLLAFAIGLAKKVLLADLFGRAVDWAYGDIAALDTTSALLVMLFYTFQIYFDFSGYCDMAIGLGLMFNIEIAANFDSPYRATSITDFWRRWHMTLTRFFRRYLYIPLGGNRRGAARTCLHLFIVFLVSGLWHGADFSFILWGALHGLFFVMTRLGEKKTADTIGRPRHGRHIRAAVGWLTTFIFVNLTWIYFRADSVAQAHQMFAKILAFDFAPINEGLTAIFYTPEAILVNKVMGLAIFSDYRLYLWLAAAFALFAVTGMKNISERLAAFKPKAISAIVTTVLLAWSILSFAEVSSFIYVGF